MRAIALKGTSRAAVKILYPTFSSSESKSIDSRFLDNSCCILNSATPPPGTIPSSFAALVALRASSILNFLSFSSTSEAAPTSIKATPPESFAILSFNFSLSYSESELSICFFIILTLSATASLVSLPTTIVVSSLVTVTLFALPSI